MDGSSGCEEAPVDLMLPDNHRGPKGKYHAVSACNYQFPVWCHSSSSSTVKKKS